MERIADFLCQVRFGEPIACRNLVIVPLFGPVTGPSVVTLAEAIRRGGAEVEEVDERGKVGAVRVSNRSIAHLLLLSGEELVGGKQDRIVNATVVIGPGQTLDVPVSCVEHGRWKGDGRGFRAAGRAVPPRIRGANAASLTSTLTLSGIWDVGQMRLWDDVKTMTQRRHASSVTGAFAAVAERDAGEVEEFLSVIRSAPGQTGMAAWVNGSFVACDLLGRPEAYAEVHDTLVRSCAMEAIDRAAKADPAPSRVFPSLMISDLMETRVIEFRSPGGGTDARLEHSRVRGSALVTSEGVVHLSAFPAVSRDVPLPPRSVTTRVKRT